jgi:hypothetical protein
MRSNGHERRRYPRSRRTIEGSFQENGPGLLNHIDNISANGVLCHTVRPIPLMTKLSIALELPRPSEKRIECEGIVVRCEPHERGEDRFKVAIIYTKLAEGDYQAIREFVDHDLQAASRDA